MKQRWASQSPLRILSVQLGVVKELDSDEVNSMKSNDHPKRSTARQCPVDVVHVLENEAPPDSSVKANL